MKLVDIGYFPKRVASRPDWLSVAQVQRICSVSHCISSAPDGWMATWAFNELGMFNSLADAERACGRDCRDEFAVFAYRQLAVRFDAGTEVPIELPALRVEPPPAHYRSLGFDAVSRSTADVYECSPLSCNGAASEYHVNEYCLFNSVDEARAAALAFSAGSWEPGPYYVLEVLGGFGL